MEEKNEQYELAEKASTSEAAPSKKTVPLVTLIVAILAVGLTAFGAYFLINGAGVGEPAHVHHYGSWETIQDASCSAEGAKERYCSCGEAQSASVPKLSHTYGNSTITKEATCQEEGRKSSECSVCMEITIFSIPKSDHNYATSIITKEPTCKEEGIETGRCTVCSKTTTSSIPKTSEHTIITDVAVAATCTKTGLTEGKHCSVCGKITKEQSTTSIIPHELIETVTVKATSSSAGTKRINCENCSYAKTESYTLKIMTSEEIYELAEESVGEITTYKKSGAGLSLGTAFVYSSDGKLITNYHVIEGAYSAKVSLNGQTYTVTKVLAYDKDIDIAILKVNASGLTPLYIQTEDIRGGSTVYAVGSSEGYTLSFSTGVIASPSRIFDGVEYIQHEAAISHGNSGGPLFNAYGEVIGINTLTNIDGQNLNFAISCSELSNVSYGAALTMSEFYEKECDPFELIKNYVIENGSYDYEDEKYQLFIDSEYSSDYSSRYDRYVYYNVTDNELEFLLYIEGSTDYLVSFHVDEGISGSYDWSYIDSYNYFMSGTIIASTYTDDTLLGYSYNNISYSSLRTSVRKLASSMVDLIISGIDKDIYSALGVSAADLGFISY